MKIKIACSGAAAAVLSACAAALATSQTARGAAQTFPCTISRPAGGESQVVRIDLGPDSTGGYAVFDVSSAKGEPVLRVSYANHPDGLGPYGCFTREKSARYLGPDVDIPVLPANVNRHEIYRICRTGRFVAPLIQGQERYVRLSIDTPGAEATISSFRIENAGVFREGAFDGSFACSDKRLESLWRISAWTCRLASIPDHNAWKCAGGRLLPRKLEQAPGEGWHRGPAPCDGMLRVEYEFDANPHFPSGRFEILAGGRRTAVLQTGTNSVHVAEAPVRRGERFGLAVPKESWPVVRRMWIERGGETAWSCDFGAPGALDGWDFPRTRPFVADGAKRDRLVWSGDLWWAGRNIFYSSNPGDEPYMRGSVELLAANQTPEGYVQACPYAERSGPPAAGEYGPFQSDEFAAWFVPVLYDYFLYSGDAATLRRLYPNVLKLMDYLAAHTAPDGHFVQRMETSKHAMAYNLALGDTSSRAFMDILLWKCRTDAAAISAACGDGESRRRFSAEAARTAESVRARHWNAKGGFFRRSDRDGGFGFEANALALATRFATPAEAASIAPRLKRTGHGKFQALAARGLMEYGFMDAGLAAIAAGNWFKLLDPRWKGARTTTECMAMHRRGWGDESHPDTAIAGILSACVLGVEPSAPGYGRFAFRPRPCAGVSHASGRVPTPLGAIEASWRIEGGVLRAAVSVPEGAKATVELPPHARAAVDGREWDGRGDLPPGRHEIVAHGVAAGGRGAASAAAAEGGMRFSASSSHEAGGWSLRALSVRPGRGKRAPKGWSSGAHDSPCAEEWLQIDLGGMKDVERIELWPRDDVAARGGGAAGFPRSFAVEGLDGGGEWRLLKKFEDAKPPERGKPFTVDFYSVVGYPRAKALRVRATRLGEPPVDEQGAWRFQLKRVEAVAR